MVDEVSGANNSPSIIQANSIQDAVYFDYLTASTGMVNRSLGALGESSQFNLKVTNLVQKIYGYATNPDVSVDLRGVPPAIGSTAQNLTADQAQAVVTALTEDDAGNLLTELNDMLNRHLLDGASNSTRVGALLLSAGTQAAVQAVANDLAAVQSAADYLTWFGDKQVQQNLLNAVAALTSADLQVESQLKEVMFLYQQFTTSGTAMLSGYDGVQNSIASNIRGG